VKARPLLLRADEHAYAAGGRGGIAGNGNPGAVS